MHKYLVLFLIIFVSNANAQDQYIVTGKVLGDDKKAIYGAQVFLNGTSKSTVSNKDGSFTLSGLSPGAHELVVSILGYQTYTQPLRIEQKNLHVEAVLSFSAVALKEVVIQPDLHREENLAIFKANFLGQSANAKNCKILNPDVLNITFDKNDRLLQADSGGEFLVIENRSLGYQLKYLVMDFRLDFKTGFLSYTGKTLFENMKGSPSRQRNWEKSRQKAYLGSSQHFLTSLFQNSIYQNGYEVQKLIRKTNTERPSDSVINTNIRRFSTPANGTVQLGSNDSVNYWLQKRKMPKTLQFLVKGNIDTDSLLLQSSENSKRLKFEDCLYVVYTREREPIEYNSWNGTFPKPLDQPNYQVSIVTMNDATAEIDQQGNLADPLSLLYEGYWAFEKVADMLPSDFKPTL